MIRVMRSYRWNLEDIKALDGQGRTQLRSRLASETMSFFPTLLRCFHAVTLFCALLMVLQLAISLEAKTIKNGRHLRHNQNHRRGSSSPQNPIDSPSLRGGTSFSRTGRRNNNNQIHRGQMQSSPSQAPDPPPVVVVNNAPSVFQESEDAEALYSNDADFTTKRLFRIEQVKYHILQKLNLKTAPNVSGIVESSNPAYKELKVQVEKSSENISNDINGGYQQDAPAQEFNEKKIFIPVEDSYPFNFTCTNDTEIMYFKINPGVIDQARLHLWIKPVSIFSKIKMEVYKVSPPRQEDGLVRMSESSIHWENIKHASGFWTRIHVFQLVAEWTRNPETNFGMVVIMKDHNNNQVAVTNSYEMPEKAPLLEVQFEHEGGKSNRSIRSSEGGKCSPGEDKCCRFPLPINFTEYSFDFIVAPKVYMANFCNGKCDYLYAQQYIHMAVVQKLHNATATYGPCCGAKELMPLNMLYYDHDRKIRFDIINDMIIEKCSCD